MVIIVQIPKLESDLLFLHKLVCLKGYSSNCIPSFNCSLIYSLEWNKKEIKFRSSFLGAKLETQFKNTVTSKIGLFKKIYFQ